MPVPILLRKFAGLIAGTQSRPVSDLLKDVPRSFFRRGGYGEQEAVSRGRMIHRTPQGRFR